MKRQQPKTEKLGTYTERMAKLWPNPYSAPTQPLPAEEDIPVYESPGGGDALLVVAAFSFLLGFFIAATLSLAITLGFLLHHNNFFS